MSQNKKPVEQENVIENINDNLTTASRKLVENKKTVMWICGIILVCGIFFCSWLWFFHSPRVKKGFDEYTKASTTATNDTVKAENLKKVADQYGFYDSGKLAALEAGESLFNVGKYEEAIAYLQKFNNSNSQLQAGAKSLIGDCYVNLKKYDDALSAYADAIKAADENPVIVPMILLKEVNIYREMKKPEKVLECLETIKKDYPDYQPTGPSIDALIARENALLGK